MALNLTVSWSPPPTSALNFSNITATDAFVAAILTHGNYSGNALIPSILDYLRSLVPSNWTEYEPTDVQLMLWTASPNFSYDFEYMLNKSISLMEDTSFQGICDFMSLEGDPDLAGIGMMASYYFIAILTSTYLIVISLESSTALRLKKYKAWRSFHGWFDQTINSFLDASLLFSTSLLLASIYRFSSADWNPDDDENTFAYSLNNAVTISTYSVFPPLLLQFTAGKLRRTGMRATLWFVNIAFVMTITVLYYQWRGINVITGIPGSLSYLLDQLRHHPSQSAWIIACGRAGRLMKILSRVMILAQVLLGFNLPCWIGLLIAMRDTQQCDTQQMDSHVCQALVNSVVYRICWKLHKRFRKEARAISIVLCFLTMWLLLGTFTALTIRLADNMGSSGRDRRWSIGQILAMATFASVIIDIVAIAIYEPKTALEGKLPTNFRLVEAPQPEANSRVIRRFTFPNTGESSEYGMLASDSGTLSVALRTSRHRIDAEARTLCTV